MRCGTIGAMRCEQCRRKIRGRGHTSITGRKLCDRCGTRLHGRTAGAVAGGGIPGARAVSGWYARAKRAMGRRD